MEKTKRILIIVILALLTGYIILKGSDMYWEHSVGLNKLPKTEQKVDPKDQERPTSKKVYAPVKEI